jgi:hypothetical protein
VVGPLRKPVPPVADLVGPIPYLDLQAILDPTAPPGWRWYNSGEHLTGLSDGAIETLIRHAPQALAPLTQTIVFRHGGAVSRVPDADTAFSNREHPYLLHPLAAWLDPSDDDRHIEWLRALVRDMSPFTTGDVYLTSARIVRTGSLTATARRSTRVWSLLRRGTTRRTPFVSITTSNLVGSPHTSHDSYRDITDIRHSRRNQPSPVR